MTADQRVPVIFLLCGETGGAVTRSGAGRRRGVLMDPFDNRADGLTGPSGHLGHVDDLPFAGVDGASDLLIELPAGKPQPFLGNAMCPQLRNEPARRHAHMVPR
ncbi:MAG: hypothetical protein JWO11_2671, partial [Nocardioides sp.]|nr:hypothetical protein [Nocardioides sp.]